MTGSTSPSKTRSPVIEDPFDPCAHLSLLAAQRKAVDQVRIQGLRHSRGSASAEECALMERMAAPGHVDQACNLLRAAPLAA